MKFSTFSAKAPVDDRTGRWHPWPKCDLKGEPPLLNRLERPMPPDPHTQ